VSQNIYINEIMQPKLADPILIQGLPGLGFVGKIAVDFLIDQLKATKFAELYSTYIGLPDGDLGVRVELDGTFTLPKYEFYAYEGKSQSFILLTGDIQPVAWGQYSVASSVIDFVVRLGCRSIVALGGYSVQGRRVDLVYALAGDKKTVEDLRQYDVLIAQSGAVKGALGVLLGLAKQRGIKCYGLLGSTPGTYPDLRAARNVLTVLMKIYRLPMELVDMDRKIEDMESRIRMFRDFQATIPQAERPRETQVPRGYIA
jgi:uncharacterized protein (TIGR00162 family)